jgi:hypothetical protein
VTRTKAQQHWPGWWDWDLELTPHVERRMEDRGFGEVDLRKMLFDANELDEDKVVGRWAVGTRHDKRLWTVIVEPDPDVELLVIVTAFPNE